MKLCKDCKHFETVAVQLASYSETEYYCARFKRSHIEPVLGKIVSIYIRNPSCGRQRCGLSDDDCGPDGKYWEEK